MFATIIIILPSKYTGGAAHLSHGPLSTVYDTAPQCLQTTVLAWYTDVMHEVKPITSGNRLALSINLIHTSNAPQPSLPATHAAVNAIRHVLLSWKRANNDLVPRKILYLLDHQYSQANFKGGALKCVDAHRLAILESLAKELGFQLALARLECHLVGSAEDNGYDDDNAYRRRRRRHYNAYYGDYSDDDEGSSDPDDLEFADIEERQVSVTNVVTVC